MHKLLFIDTETGGLEPESASLLSVGMVCWCNGIIEDKKEIFLKERDLKVSNSSLEINQINLDEHLKIALEHELAIQEIINFCYKNFEAEPITLAGHNIGFDVTFLKHLFLKSPIPFRKLFSHRMIDTASILAYFTIVGILPEDISSSDKAFEYFSISTIKRHTALDDALSTAYLFSALLNMARESFSATFPL